MKYNYDPADEYFTINDDPSLVPIKIYIDKIIHQVYKHYNTPYYRPDIKKIDGYGLAPKDQYFVIPKYPERLKSLEERVKTRLEKELGQDKASPQKLIIEIRNELKAHKKDYPNEILFIQKQWYFRLFGYWCFINGKPTYIAPSHYSYLTTWDLGDAGLPQYRDRDRRRALIETYLYTCTETFKDMEEIKPNVWQAVPNDDGEYEMIDLGRRVMFGSVYPKPRRDGATHFSLSFGYDIITLVTGASSLMGIISFDAVSATDYYRNMLVPAFKKKPFYFRPLWSGSATPLGKMEFRQPQTMNGEPELESIIDPANQANRRYYDGKKLFYIHMDEEGKTRPELCDILEGWNIIVPTLSQGGGSKIHGYSMHPSTVEELEYGGGKQYFELCSSSNYYIRNKISGQTQSGLVVYFIPAYDGLDGYIGRYGESIIDTPTPDQADYIGRKYGAKEYLQSKRSELQAEKTPKGAEEYRSFIRKFPIWYDECFYGTTGDIGFNMDKLDRSIARINNLEDKPVSVGNFYLQGNLQTGKIVFREEVSGRMVVSKLLKDGQDNKRVKKSMWDNMEQKMMPYWHPENPRFVASGDPFKFDDKNERQIKHSKNKMSDGGGACLELRDKNIDRDDKPMEEWDTFNFVCTYQARTPDRELYCQDMLYMCIYYGAKFYPELNVEVLWEYFYKQGFAGYMLYGNDSEGRQNAKPGFYTTLRTGKQNLFNVMRDFVEYRSMKCNHKELLEDCKNIKNIDDLTNYDRFTACGGCLLGSQSLTISYLEKSQSKTGYTIHNFF